MAKKGGAFGNPLTTGIALNFKVDMTPYRQMMKDNLDFAKNQAADIKAKQKEFKDILKNITYDDSKILKRRRDGARVKYAELISNAIKHHKDGDPAGVQMAIVDFQSGMNNLIDERTQFKAYEKLAKDGTHFVNMDYINAIHGENAGATSDDNILLNYGDEIIYDSKSGTFNSHAIKRADPLAFVNKVVSGMPMKALKGSKPVYIPETREYKYDLSKVEDPDALYAEMAATWLGGGESHIETMRRDMNLTPDDLDGTGAIENATEYMRMLTENKILGERYSSPPRPTSTKPTYAVTDDNIGDVSFSGKPSSVVSTESSTPEQIEQARVDKITGEVQKYVTDAIAADPDNVEDELAMESYLEPFGLNVKVSGRASAIGKEEVAIQTGSGNNLAFLDPTSNTFVQDLTEIILENGTESYLETQVGTPETTPEEFLTPESDSFFANIAGGKKPTTDWAIPAGATVILTGDQGAVEVKLKNDMTFEKGKFQKAAKYKDKSGDTDTYYDIMFPIDQRDKESYFTNLFNDSDVLTDFKRKSPDQLPKSMYVKQDNGLFKSLLSVLQTSKNIGTMTEGSLQKAMDKFMKVSTSGTTSSTGGANTPSFQ